MDSTLITIECIDEIADFAGHQGRKSRRSPRRRCAARSTSREASSAAWRAARRVSTSPRSARVYDERLRLSPGARKHARRTCKRVGAKTPARVRRIHVLHRPAARRGSASTTRSSNTLEIVEREAHRPRRSAIIVDADAKAETLRATAAESYAGEDGLDGRHRRRRERPADARARRRLRSRIAPSRVVRAQATLRHRSLRARRGAQSLRAGASLLSPRRSRPSGSPPGSSRRCASGRRRSPAARAPSGAGR